MQCRLLAAAVFSLLSLQSVLPNAARAQTPLTPPPGTYRTSWVGNSFGGDGGPNGFGYWVQNGADEIKVAPDGTIFAGVGWDENGRCVGLYKNGAVNRNLLKAGRQWENSAWGWGTGNNALAVWGNTVYVANGGKFLLRFRWQPGDLESVQFVDALPLPGVAIGLSASEKYLAVVYNPNVGRKEGTPPIRGAETVEIRNRATLAVVQTWKLNGARDAAFSPKGELWTLAGNMIQHSSLAGKQQGEPVPDLQAPSALAFAPDGTLIIPDNGARQQILFFDVRGAKPRLVKNFGAKGGLLSGAPGKIAPDKLFAIVGAGQDAQGNLSVAMSYKSDDTGGPNGNLILRTFAPDGKLLHDYHNLAFVDTFGFDPDSDGAQIYSRTGIFNLDLAQTKPGAESRLTAMTLDPLDTADPRQRYGSSALIRNVGGKRLLYTIGQYAGGYGLYTFADNSEIAHKVGETPKSKGETWAWYVAPNGDIWQGDPPDEKVVRRYAFAGWDKEGKQRYNWDKPQTWARPEGWDTIRRIFYDPRTDSLYLAGYLTGQRIETWGVVGSTLRRYDHWLKGTPTIAWTNEKLPRDENPDPKEGPITPESMDIAGDYAFFGMTRPNAGKQRVFILRLSDGGFVGTLTPGEEVGGNAGWLDMPYAVAALQRKNGEYLILVEEDARGKNLLYRWTPKP